MAQKRRWVDEIVLVGDVRGFVSGMATGAFALNQVAFAAGAVGRALAAPTQAAHTFQTNLNQVQAVAQATGAQMEILETQALDMGASTKFSASEAAEAQAFLAMAGMSVDQTIGALPATLALAAAGNLDLADSADIATNVMSGYGLGVEELGRATDVIATTAASANTNVMQVGEAMKYAAPVASAAGLSFEDAAAAVGLLGNAGLQADMAGTALRGMITKLLNPSNQASKALDRLGVSVTDSSGKMLPMVDIVRQFEGAGLSASDAMTIFGQRAGPGMLALVSQGSGALDTLKTKLEESEGAAQRMADVQQQGLVGSMTEASSAASNLAIIVGQALTPAAMAGLDAFTGGARALGDWFRESETARVSSQALGVGVAFVATNAGSLSRVVVILTAAYLAQKNQAILLRGATLAWAAATGTAHGVAVGYRLVVVGTTRALGLYRAGLLGARAASLAWAAATGVVRLALVALKWAMVSTGIGALVVLVGTGLVFAFREWGGSITGFLQGAWNKLIGAIEVGIGWIRPLAEWAGVKLPDNLGALQFATEKAGEAVEDTGETAGETADVLSGELDPALLDTGESADTFAAQVKSAEEIQQEFIGTLWESVEAIDAQQDALKRDAAASNKLLESFGMLVPSAQDAVAQFDVMTGALDPPALAVGRVNESLLQVPLSLEAAEAAARVLAPSVGEQVLAGFAATVSPQNVSSIFVRAFTGGGGLEGGFKALGVQAGGHIATGLQGWLNKPGTQSMFGGAFGGMLKGAIGMAVPIIGPALGSLAGWVAGKLGGLFGGPSEEVQAARQSMEEYAASVADMVGKTQSSIERYQGWLAAGFTESHATIVTHFQDLALANGHAAKAGSDLWLEYQRAVEEGNQQAIDAVMGQIEAWGGAAEAVEAAAAAAEAHAAAVQDAADRLMGLPTDQAVRDFELVREAWESLTPEERAKAFDNYTESLRNARDAGIELTKVEQEFLAAVEAREAELEALKERQAAELEAIRERQAAELEAVENTRAERLDMLRESQSQALELMRAAQERELAELKSAQEAELSELRAARQAALGVVETAIQRELEEERIRVRLRLDLQKAGNNQEAIEAAQKRAAEARGRLDDKRAMEAAMAEAEALIRQKYQDEINGINAHWDAKEAETAARHTAELGELETHHAAELTELESTHADELAEFNAHWDAVEAETLARHAAELAETEAHHAAALSALESHHDDVLAELRGFTSSVASETAAAAAAARANPIVITTIRRTVNQGGGGAGGARFGGGMAAGGLGVVTQPTLFLAGEAGPEGYWFSGARGQVAPPGSAGGVEGIRSALAGMGFRVELGSEFTRIMLERMPDEGERLL